MDDYVFSIVFVVNSSGTIVELKDDPYLSDLLPDKHATMFSANKSNPRRLISHLVMVHNGMVMNPGYVHRHKICTCM